MHQLAQLLAITNRNYLPKETDDSHTNLYFDALGNRLMGRWFGAPQKEMMLSLNLSVGHFQWINKKMQVMDSIAVAGKNLNQLKAAIKNFLTSQGFETAGYENPMHYAIPDYDLPKFMPSPFDPKPFEGWAAMRSLANAACIRLAGYFQLFEEPRIWPHHFDTGIYLQVLEQLGIGFGLAMKDKMVDDAYFYLAAYASNIQFDYKAADSLDAGFWIAAGGWKGAVLPVNLLQEDAGGNEMHVIDRFLQQSLQWFLNQT